MRMVLHGISDNVGYFVEAPVVQCLHGMQYPSLDRFQSIVNVGNRAVENRVGCIVQIPALEHTA